MSFTTRDRRSQIVQQTPSLSRTVPRRSGFLPAGIWTVWIGFCSLWLGAETIAQDRSDRLQVPRLRTLDDYFPFTVPGSMEEWNRRRVELRENLLVSLGLWPLPERTPLNPVVHGLIDGGDYTIEKVYFESWPGFHVTGNLYRPKNRSGPLPAVLCPHGHWRNGRFLWSSDEEIQRELAAGGEQLASNARSVLQSRCATLARMGCLVFHYDMLGYADSQQIGYDLAHGFKDRRTELESRENWGLFSPAAEMHLQSVMGLQTWNSIRALDFLESLPEVDRSRIGVTGASGGGTQTFILCALDDRPAAAFPAVMVSTAMQGGCTCENCCLLRVQAGNVDLAALFAPKPLGMTAANDWTVEMSQKGFPELQALYQLYGQPDNVALTSRTEFGHNYNLISREAMYGWFDRHLRLAADSVSERPLEPLPPEKLTVYDAEHPRPPGGVEFERQLLRHWTADSQKQLDWSKVDSAAEADRLRQVYRTAFRALIQLPAGAPEISWDPSADRLGPTGKELRVQSGWLQVPGQSFQTPLTRWTRSPDDGPSRPTVILLGEVLRTTALRDGLSSLGSALTDDGYELVMTDLLYRGEFADPNNVAGENRLVANGRRAAAYTFGYNRTVLAQQAVQIVQLVRGLKAEPNAPTVHLVVSRAEAPAAVLAATQLSPTELEGLALEIGDFDWAALTEFEDPRFLPGILKYGSWGGCLSVEPARRLMIFKDSTTPDWSAAAHAARWAESQNRWESLDNAALDRSLEKLLEWLRK